MTDNILRLPDVIRRSGLSRSSIYLRMHANEFPLPISLGARAVGWLESEIEEWIVSCIQKSRRNGHD